MPNEELVLVKCEFSRGGFPTEAVFYVKAPQGGVFIGTAPIEYCYGKDKKPLNPEIPRGQRVPGFVLGVELGEREQKGTVRVHLPNGEVYDLEEDLLVRNGNIAHVSLQP